MCPIKTATKRTDIGDCCMQVVYNMLALHHVVIIISERMLHCSGRQTTMYFNTSVRYMNTVNIPHSFLIKSTPSELMLILWLLSQDIFVMFCWWHKRQRCWQLSWVVVARKNINCYSWWVRGGRTSFSMYNDLSCKPNCYMFVQVHKCIEHGMKYMISIWHCPSILP